MDDNDNDDDDDDDDDSSPRIPGGWTIAMKKGRERKGENGRPAASERNCESDLRPCKLQRATSENRQDAAQLSALDIPERVRSITANMSQSVG